MQGATERHHCIRSWRRQAIIFELANIGKIQSDQRRQFALIKTRLQAELAQCCAERCSYASLLLLTSSICYVELIVNTTSIDIAPTFRGINLAHVNMERGVTCSIYRNRVSSNRSRSPGEYQSRRHCASRTSFTQL